MRSLLSSAACSQSQQHVCIIGRAARQRSLICCCGSVLPSSSSAAGTGAPFVYAARSVGGDGAAAVSAAVSAARSPSPDEKPTTATTAPTAAAKAKTARSADEKARYMRPPGWHPPGPPPVGVPDDQSENAGELQVGPGETLSYLCGDWRIFQLSDGHRWSLDDHLTAVVALQEAQRQGPEAVTATLDLGCGIGSALLLVAWGLPHATAIGVEAQVCVLVMGRLS